MAQSLRPPVRRWEPTAGTKKKPEALQRIPRERHSVALACYVSNAATLSKSPRSARDGIARDRIRTKKGALRLSSSAGFEHARRIPMPPKRPLVLVAEDDRGVREPLVKFLVMHGFDVVPAETADAALDRLAERPVQAAVVDLRLRQGSGREVIVSIPPPVPVIIFSAVPDESGQLEQMRPNTRLILKPFSLLMLVEVLQKMMAAAERKDPMTRRIPAPRV